MGSARPACISAPLKTSPSVSPWTFGADEIDRALPWKGLGLTGVHEVQAASYRDSWAALGFALALVARRMASLPSGDRSLILWAFSHARGCEFGHPHGPGLAALGLDPDKFVMVETTRESDLAWALEEGLKARALAILLGQIDISNWTLGRRLALAAQAQRTPCLIVSSSNSGQMGGSGLGGAFTRWRVAARASTSAPFDTKAPGAPGWRIDLERCRWGRAALSWEVEWSDETNCFRLAASLADRAPETRETELR